MKDEIIKNLVESERQITYAIYQSSDNYEYIRNRIKVEDFINEEMRELFSTAIILYQKYNFNKLDKQIIKPILEIENKSEGEDSINQFKDVLNIHLDLMLDFEYNIDIKGTFEFYTKNLGLYNFFNFIEGEGGLETMYHKMKDLSSNSEDIRDYLLYNIEQNFRVDSSKIEESYLEDGMTELVKEIMEDRVEVGLPQMFSKYLQLFTRGIHKGVQYFGAWSGAGKTTWSSIIYLLPILFYKNENGERTEKLLIIANEQDKPVFQKLLLVAIYTHLYRKTKRNENNKLKFISRGRISNNEATDWDKKLLNETVIYYKKYFEGRVKFIFTPKFVPDEIARHIRTNSRLGFNNIFIDTLKAEIKGEYALLSNLSTTLDKIAKEHKLRIISTVQLAIHTTGRKYLDHTCLAESKQIVEIAEHSIYFRNTTYEELVSLKIYSTNSDGEIKELDGEDLMKLQKDGWLKFMLLFIGKNRHGEDKKVILARYNFDSMYYEEIGIVEGIKYDG